jgi:hypothetical protein
MSNTNKTDDTVTLRKSRIEFVMDYIREEQETMQALSSAIVSCVAVQDTKNPKDSDNIFAFRLAELLDDRLGDAKFEKNIRLMLGVNE